MHAIQVNQHGGPEVLQWQEMPEPELRPGALRVRVSAVGVNYIDTYHRSGAYPFATPGVLGLEGAGIVQEVGAGVEGFSMGDRVAWADQPGSYAETVVVEASRALRVPDGLSDELAAAIPLQGMTAHFLTQDTFDVQAGQDVLVHAGAGGVGRILIQLAKHRGARVITTVSTQAKEDIARACGADEVIRYDREPVAAAVRSLTQGVGCHVVYDGVGRSTFEDSLASLRIRGTLVVFGAASGQPDPLEVGRLSAMGSLFVTRPTLFHHMLTPQELGQRSADVFEWARSGQVDFEIGARFALADAAQAHRALESRATTGKVLLTV